MTVEQHDVIDFVGIDPAGNVVLTISDHLRWDSVNEHLFCLQEKVNAYLRFIESGEIKEKYPETTGRSIVIDVVLKHTAPAGVQWFFDEVSAAIKGAGFRFTTRLLSSD